MDGKPAPTASSGPADQSLWAFTQDMPTGRDDRMAEATERQREAQRQSVLDDVRERAEGINRGLEAELPEHVLRMAYDLKEYILGVRRDEDDELDAELGKVQAAIDQLEKAGYRKSAPLDRLRESELALSRTTLMWLIGAFVFLALMGWGVWALLKWNEADNARVPGRMQVDVKYGPDKSLTAASLENVRLVPDNADSKALFDTLSAHHDNQIIFNELKSKRGSLPAADDGRTDQSGLYQAEKLPAGKYYLIVLTTKNEDVAASWMIPLEIFPAKVTKVVLRDANRLK